MSCARGYKRQPPWQRGFTLVEMAVVVVIGGILILALLPALLSIQQSGRLTATQTNLQTLLRATAAYTLANGCLPCPTPGSVISGSGLGKVGTAGNTPCGVCGAPDGIPPFAALGLDAVTAKDGWGRWITMHVDIGLTGGQPYVPGQPGLIPCSETETTGGLPGCGLNEATRSGLCRANLPATDRITVNLPNSASATAAVIFVSHGANGYGAYRPQTSPSQCVNWRLPFPSDVPACTNTRGRERCNDECVTPGHAFWVAERSEYFDDVIVHAGRNALVSLFGNAACTTPW